MENVCPFLLIKIHNNQQITLKYNYMLQRITYMHWLII